MAGRFDVQQWGAAEADALWVQDGLVLSRTAQDHVHDVVGESNVRGQTRPGQR